MRVYEFAVIEEIEVSKLAQPRPEVKEVHHGAHVEVRANSIIPVMLNCLAMSPASRMQPGVALDR
jgi:hypothetical protein